MEGAAASRTMLCALPLALLQSVLARLPADARTRACVVCRAWNAALAERSLWARLDLSAASGVAVAVTNEVLRAATARAGGQLEALDLSDCDDVRVGAVMAVVTASAATLLELIWLDNPDKNTLERTQLGSEHVEALLRAAPQLRNFHLDAGCSSVADASRLLRGALLFAPLRVHMLMVDEDVHEAPDEAAVLALAADVAGHAWLNELTLDFVPLNSPAALDALVDAALARQLCAVRIFNAGLSPASAPALARLMGGGLVSLAVVSMQPQLDVPAAVVLSNALRASTALTLFKLGKVGLWRCPSAAVLMFSAFLAHPSLCVLDLSYSRVTTIAMQAAAGAMLAALVAADSPPLHELDISYCRLGDVGLDELVDALPYNTHLRTLRCAANSMSEAFMRERLRPALHANLTLRKVLLIKRNENGDEQEEEEEEHAAILRELQDMVAARAAAAAQ
jgi:hypothetical protein